MPVTQTTTTSPSSTTAPTVTKTETTISTDSHSLDSHSLNSTPSLKENSLEWQELLLNFQTMLRWTLAAVLDALFLAGWVWIQWMVNKSIKGMELQGLDFYLLTFLQWTFGIASLVPILSKIVCDIIKMLKRTVRKIKEAE